MAKKDQKSQEKKVLTEWQKRNLEFLRKKETKDSEEMTNKTGVYPEKATSQENKIPVKKKVKKKKKKKSIRLAIFQLHNKILQDLLFL